MAALIHHRRIMAFLGGALLVSAAPHADSVARWRPFVAEASARFDIPADWIERVMRAESGGRTHGNGRPITSRAGAMGLMQLMPGTWAELRAAHGLGPDPHDPRDNILAGTAYLRTLYDRFGYPGLFAAYNAGPARYTAHLTRGQPLPGETRAYLLSVAGDTADRPASDPAKPADPLFAVRHRAGASPAPVAPDTSGPSLLFVPLAAD